MGGDIILLHGCAHNPTGVDPTKEQWDTIADTCKELELIPFFDCAYQGFATGDLSAEAAKSCMTQMCAIIRPMYSNPPAHGARIVKAVLGNAENYEMWKKEMGGMSERILAMRKALRAKIEELKTPGTWNHITDQIGMFTFTGLTAKQVDVMIEKHHIYLLSSGRISMAGVASSNVEYIAKAINDVVVNCKE